MGATVAPKPPDCSENTHHWEGKRDVVLGHLALGFHFLFWSAATLGWREACWPYMCRWGPTNDFNPVNIYLYVGPCIKHWCYSEVFQMWALVLKKGTDIQIVCQLTRPSEVQKREWLDAEERDELWLSVRYMEAGLVEWVIFKQAGWEGPLGGLPGSGRGSMAGQESTWWILYWETQVGTWVGSRSQPKKIWSYICKDLSWVPVFNTLASKASYLRGNSSVSCMCWALEQKPRKAWGLKNTKPKDQHRRPTDAPLPPTFCNEKLRMDSRGCQKLSMEQKIHSFTE